MPSSHLLWSEGGLGTCIQIQNTCSVSKAFIRSCKKTWKGRDSLRCYSFLPEAVPPVLRVLHKTAFTWLFFRRDGKYSFPGYFPKIHSKKGERGFSLGLKTSLNLHQSPEAPQSLTYKSKRDLCSSPLASYYHNITDSKIRLRITFTTAVLN